MTSFSNMEIQSGGAGIKDANLLRQFGDKLEEQLIKAAKKAREFWGSIAPDFNSASVINSDYCNQLEAEPA